MSIRDNIHTFKPHHPRLFVSRIDDKEDLEHIVSVLAAEPSTFIAGLDNVDVSGIRISETSVYVAGELTRFGKAETLFSVGDFFVASENGHRLVTSDESIYNGDIEKLHPELLTPFYVLDIDDVPAEA